MTAAITLASCWQKKNQAYRWGLEIHVVHFVNSDLTLISSLDCTNIPITREYWASSKLTLNSLRGRINMKTKTCTSVHRLHLSTSAQLQYRIHCLSAWMSKRILQFLERGQNHFHYVRNGYPFIHRNPKHWRLQSTQTFFDQRPVEKPSSETLLRLAELVLMLNLESKILSKTSKSSAVIPKLNLYFLYHHLFHSNATKT